MAGWSIHATGGSSVASGSSPTVSYNNQDINSFCQQVRDLYNNSFQANACNVSSAASRLLKDNCGGVPNNPNDPNNPNNPNNPNQPPGGTGRIISCNVSANQNMPFQMLIPASPLGFSKAKLSLSERRGGIWGFFGLTRKVVEVEAIYRPIQGRIPETLTAVVRYNDTATKRKVVMKHSGYAGGPLSMNIDVNGTNLMIDCNRPQNPGGTTNNLRNGTNGAPFNNSPNGSPVITGTPMSDVGNLVCVGSSRVTGSNEEENIQFIKPINSFVAGEMVPVTEAVSVSIDKANSMLTINSNIDQLLGPNMTSSSSVKADTLVESSEGVGNAKITCSVK